MVLLIQQIKWLFFSMVIFKRKVNNRQINAQLGVNAVITPLTATIGIVFYNNSKDEIEWLLKSIRNSQEVAPATVNIIAINNGDAQSSEILALFQQYDVILLPSQGNVGAATGNNIVMQHAFTKMNSDLYFAVNPDGFLHPLALSRMIKQSVAHQHSCLIEGVLTPVANFRRFAKKNSLDINWASGACCLLPKKLYEITQGFDGNLFLYCEDLDLSWRVRHADFPIKCCIWAYCYHDPSNKINNANVRKNLYLSYRYMGHKWGHPAFRRWCEERLVIEKFFSNLEALPKIDHLPKITTTKDIPQFNKVLGFSEKTAGK